MEQRLLGLGPVGVGRDGVPAQVQVVGAQQVGEEVGVVGGVGEAGQFGLLVI